MANDSEPKTAAATEKTSAEAATSVSPQKIARAVEAGTPKPPVSESKIAAAVAAQAASKPRKAPKRLAKAKAKPVKPRVAAKPAPTPNTVSAKPPFNALKDKIMATANTAQFSETAKETAAEMQTRAKAAFEKMQAYAGEITEMGKGNVEALVQSGKILGTGMQDIARGEVEAAKGAFETATADIKALAGVKSPTELFKLQGEIARRNFDAAMAHYSRNAEASMKLFNDAFAPISSRMSLAAEKISKAA